MSDINICSVIGQNTGAILCDPKKGVPKKLVLGAASFTSSNWNADGVFLTALLGKINQAQGAADKMYPFPLIEGNTDNSEAAVFGNLGYGTKLKLRDGLPSYSFQVRCGESLFKRLRAFDSAEIPCGVIDANNRYWGTINAAGVFKGYTAIVSVTGNGFEDGAAAEKKTATIDISLTSASEFYDKSAWIDGIAESDIKGLNEFQLASVGTVAATTKFEAKIVQASLAGLRTVVNLADFYSSEMAVGANWVAKTGATFATSLPITGVTYNSSDKTWSVAFDSTTYTALSSAVQIKVSFAPPATLYAAGVTGVEGISVIVAKP